MMKTLFLLSLLFFVACESDNKNQQFYFENKVNVRIDSIAFDKKEQKKIDDFYFNCFTASYHINSDSSLSLIYLVDSSYIVDYNLTSKNVNRIKIVGTNPVISSVLSINKGKDFYSILNELSELFIYTVDTLGHSESVINSLESFKKRNTIVSSELGFGYRLPFKNDSSIILNVIDLENRSNTFAKMNLLTKKTIFFEFKLHNDFFKCFHPLRNGIKMEIFGDTLLVNYQFSEKIDLFSISRSKYIGSKDVKSKYQVKAIPCLKTKKNDFENERYPIEADYYDGLTYNPYKKCFYRLYYHSLPRQNDNDDYTIFTDKIVSIAIFDQNLNWIGEQIVKRENYFGGIVPHPDGALSLWGDKHGDNYYLKLVKHD